MANQAPSIILVDCNNDNEFTSGEIISVSAEEKSKEKTDLETSSERYCKNHLKIHPSKERILDKSFEL